MSGIGHFSRAWGRAQHETNSALRGAETANPTVAPISAQGSTPVKRLLLSPFVRRDPPARGHLRVAIARTRRRRARKLRAHFSDGRCLLRFQREQEWSKHAKSFRWRNRARRSLYTSCETECTAESKRRMHRNLQPRVRQAMHRRSRSTELGANLQGSSWPTATRAARTRKTRVFAPRRARTPATRNAKSAVGTTTSAVECEPKCVTACEGTCTCEATATCQVECQTTHWESFQTTIRERCTTSCEERAAPSSATANS